MTLYFEKYSLQEKLQEYGKVSACKKALELDLIKHINEDTRKDFDILKSGNIGNILEIGDIVSKILNKI